MSLIKENKRIHKCWSDIIQRCTNVNCKSYKNYGGRGIVVCDEWLESSEEFIKWALANGYKDYLTIERVNPNGSYSPSNCVWADRKTQAINKRVTGSIPFYGVYLKKQAGRLPKYSASITIEGKKKHIGLYETPEEAAKARDVYIIDNGLSYPLNFSDEVTAHDI